MLGDDIAVVVDVDLGARTHEAAPVSEREELAADLGAAVILFVLL